MPRSFIAAVVVLISALCTHVRAQDATAPDSPAGEALSWFLTTWNEDELTVDAVEAHFAADFLALVPSGVLVQNLGGLASQYGPFELVQVNSEGPALEAVLRANTGDYFTLRVVLSDDDSNLIAGMRVSLAGWLNPDLPETWQALDTMAMDSAPSASILVAELNSDGLSLLHTLNPEAVLGIGSTFKLWVLGAAARAVADGRMTWDDPVTLQAEYRSLGPTQCNQLPNGHVMTLREACELMISLSDNTCTDHVLAAVGREAAEAIMIATGFSEPDLNRPLLSTREFFLLKRGAGQDLRARYLSGDAATRRDIVDNEMPELDLAVAMVGALSWVEPRAIDTVEWFASATDLCNTMLYLRAQFAEPFNSDQPLPAIMSMNPGVRFNPERWNFQGFKGGSEPGVYSATWLLQRDDERWFCVSATLNDPTAELDQQAVPTLGAAAARLLEALP